MRRPMPSSDAPPEVWPSVWDVVRVPFPYTNRPVRQHRPALVVACLVAPGAPALLWVLMITSAGHRRWAGDVEISDLLAAGLPASSMVRSAKITTVEATEAEPIGTLPNLDRTALRQHLEDRMAAALR